jgi:isopentenyldiphosphate isomerase
MVNQKIKFENVIKVFLKELPKFPDGRIDYSHSNKAAVLTCFVKYKDKILLLKRSAQVRTYQGLWNSVAGYLDELCPVKQKALKEIHEELGIETNDVKSVKLGKPFEFTDKAINKTWIIFPVLVELNKKPKIVLDWEQTEYNWIEPTEIKKYNVVPNLDKTLASVITS